jgi:hypothetical protein
MRLINHTPFPADLFRTIIDKRRFAASVLVRVTYDITPRGLVPSAEQPWKVSAGPWETEYGLMDGDEIFYKGGTDLFVFGHARAPGGRDVTELEIVVEVGKFRRRLLVFGDRVWERRGKALAPSAPRPFKAMPLTLANAYGGTSEWDSLATPWPANPKGKGYFLEESKAVGQPLPNIEDPTHRIAKWDDRPEPASLGICPMQSPSRVLNGLRLDDQHQVKEILPTWFNTAYPAMILQNVRAGDQVRLTGLADVGPVTFSLPDARFTTRLQFDQEVIERPLAIDQLGIEVDKMRAFIAYRYPFRYVMYPLQRRSCELRAEQLPSRGPC